MTRAHRVVTGPAQERLTVALVGLLDVGLCPVCAGRDEWLSDDPDERAQAAVECAPCPVLIACDQAATATRERFGVWAGVDRTRPEGRRRR